MKCLITGGAGFIGSHLVDKLVARGDSVIVLDDLSTGRLSNLSNNPGDTNVDFVHGSILNADLVDDCVRRSDSVLHLAAAVGVRTIIEKPLESLTTNIRGSEIVIEKCDKYFRPIFITSTSEIYGKNESDLLGEEDDRILGSPLNARWSYSEAKAIEEILAYSYWRKKGLPARIVRLFNTVGPRQVGFYGMVVPSFVASAMDGRPLTVYGTGNQTRCFGHVSDITDGILSVLDSDAAPGEVFNIGNDEEVSIYELADRIIRMTGSDSRVVLVPYETAYGPGFEDMQRRVPSTKKLRDLTGWKPTKSLDETLRDLINYRHLTGAPKP